MLAGFSFWSHCIRVTIACDAFDARIGYTGESGSNAIDLCLDVRQIGESGKNIRNKINNTYFVI